MMFLNFFGAIPLLLPNIVWNFMIIIYIGWGEEFGKQFIMGWDYPIDKDHVHFKEDYTKDENDPNDYFTPEQSTCKLV